MTEMLQMLKVDLGISIESQVYDQRLSQYLESAKAEISREGYTYPETLTVDDMQITVMYAAWMWRKRDGMDAMPRMLRYILNNRILSQKMQEVPNDD